MKEIKEAYVDLKEDGSKVAVIIYKDGTRQERKVPTSGTYKFVVKK